MSFLTINGIAVRIAVDSVSMTYVDVGGTMDRGLSGDLVGGPTSTKREWNMTTTPVPVAEVDAWVGLIEGKGNSVSFDSTDTPTSYLWSSRGATPVAAGGASRASSFPWRGGGNLNLGYGGQCLYVAPREWTLMFWRRDIAPDSSGWMWRAITSSGYAWDALYGPYIPGDGDTAAWYLPGDEDLRIGVHNILGAGHVVAFDDMVVLPFVPPDAWVSAFRYFIFNHYDPFPALPRVLAEGSFAPTSVLVRGRVTGMKAIRVSSGGELTTGYALEFTLREV